jgi:glycerophosphoryl diester phosphodiesterase
MSPNPVRRPLVIAHMGASGLAPENTLAAFKLAIALGADGVEMDVRATADGQPVVIHDARVDRTTDGSGEVSRLTAAQISRLDAGAWFERRLSARPRMRRMMARDLSAASAKYQDGVRTPFLGEPVPALESVLAFLSGVGHVRTYIEIKRIRANRRELLDSTIGLIRRFRMERSVTLLSFDHSIVRLAKEIASEIGAGVIVPTPRAAGLTTRAIIRCAQYAGADEVALHFGLATPRAIDILHQHGLRVSAWKGNRRIIMHRLIECGTDSILTSFPNRLADLIHGPARSRFEQD